MNERIRNFWMSLLPVFVFMGVQIAISFIYMELQVVSYIGQMDTLSFQEMMEQFQESVLDTQALLMMGIISQLITIAICGVWYRVAKLEYKEKPIRQLSTNWKISLAGLAIAFVIGLQYLCQYFMSVVALWLPKWIAEYEMMMESAGLTDELSVGVILTAVILAPICEELTCRGVCYGYARKNMSFWGANVFQALLFAGMHMNPVQGIYAFVLGLVLGMVREKSGSLWWPIGLHFLFNIFGTVGAGMYVLSENPMIYGLVLFGSMLLVFYSYKGMEKILQKGVKIEQSSADNTNT